MSHGSRHRFRIKARPGPGGKQILWIQQQLAGFLWWRWWEPVHYVERSIKAEIVECHRRILELLPELEDAKKDVSRAQKEIDNHNPNAGISKPWLGPVRPRNGDIPDCEDEMKKVAELYKGQGRPYPHGGTRSLYVPEDKSHLIPQLVEGQSYQHAVAYRKPNQGNQQQNQGNSKRNKHHRDGGNNQNSGGNQNSPS